ncbi:MAG: hypothetical protein LBU83_07685 [Bacteroidales bacterium]|jgi:predicted P-loop ATPase|nr:hypothetical protein [Bacteroidales bacterium]
MQEILNLLKNVKGGNGQYTALCPAHEDRESSLSVKIEVDKMLLYCHAGCSVEAIISKLGLTMADLFAKKPRKSTAKKQKINTITYEYKTADGFLAYRKQRYEFDDGSKSFAFFTPDGKKGRGGKSCLYNLPAVLTADTVYFCEGEKCVDAITKAGRVATSLDTGAKSIWRKEFNAYFENKTVLILPDNDDSGMMYANKIAHELPGSKIIKLPDLPKGGDVFDWLQQGWTIAEIDELPTVEPEQINNISDVYGVLHDEKITIAGVAFHLEETGVTVKYNETTRKVNIAGLDKFNSNYIVDNLPIIIYNQLNIMYKKCSVGIIQDYLKVITMNNAYNPVLELIESGKWDSKDRFIKLLNILRIAEDDFLSHVLIYKWLWQNLSMLRNERGDYGADGVLVLQGNQGVGKTSFVRKMALREEWFKEGLKLDARDKDTILKAVSCWIGELGEIESTFKSDINALKAFITRAMDTERLPYGRVAQDIPRRSSFAGTCNSDEYLVDETGNRRFWTVPVGDIDLDALKKFDMLQLYRQIDEKAKHDRQGYRLTREENKQLAERNDKHTKPIKAELEIRDILSGMKETDSKQSLTVSAFKEKYPSLKQFDAREIGRALNKIGIKQERTAKGRFYKFPLSMKKTGWNP